jgi:hypothetical protein
MLKKIPAKSRAKGTTQGNESMSIRAGTRIQHECETSGNFYQYIDEHLIGFSIAHNQLI